VTVQGCFLITFRGTHARCYTLALFGEIHVGWFRAVGQQVDGETSNRIILASLLQGTALSLEKETPFTRVLLSKAVLFSMVQFFRFLDNGSPIYRVGGSHHGSQQGLSLLSFFFHA
jgi:hypothetical protein